MRWTAIAVLLACAAAARAGEEPLDRVSTDLKKAIPKAIEGHAKSKAMLLATGPLAKKAAREVEEKVLATWSFPPLKAGREKREFEHGGRTRNYGLFVPKNYSLKRAWPLILSLHGAGGNGLGELDHEWAGSLSDWPGFVVAPSGDPPGEQWMPQEAFVLACLRDILRAASIDGNRVYVNGFSNGGNGSWYMAERYPGLFAAMCTRGGGNPNSGWLRNLSRVPAFIIHGELDGTIRVDSDRRDAKSLADLGYVVHYAEQKGGGHEPFTRENANVIDFFLKHPRDPWPKKLEFVGPGGGRFRDLWIELPDGAGGAVTAEVLEGNRIDVRGASRFVLWLSDPLVDLDQEVTVSAGGAEVFKGKVERRFADLLADLEDRFDRQAPAWARLEVPAK